MSSTNRADLRKKGNNEEVSHVEWWTTNVEPHADKDGVADKMKLPPEGPWRFYYEISKLQDWRTIIAKVKAHDEVCCF